MDLKKKGGGGGGGGGGGVGLKCSLSFVIETCSRKKNSFRK